jgi:hypothetical protein
MASHQALRQVAILIWYMVRRNCRFERGGSASYLEICLNNPCVGWNSKNKQSGVPLAIAGCIPA